MPAVVEVCAFRDPAFYFPAYTAPPRRGRRVEEYAWFPGDRGTIVETVDTRDYVSGRAEEGVFINLWCRRNKNGKAPRSGVTFCRLTGPADAVSSRASG